MPSAVDTMLDLDRPSLAEAERVIKSRLANKP
jgi:hypothetical protein